MCGQDTGRQRGLICPVLCYLSLFVAFVSLSFSSVSGPEEVFLVPLLHFLELFTKLWEEGRILGWTGVALAFGGEGAERRWQ